MTQFTIREAAPDASSFTAVLAGSCHHGGHGVLVATGTRHSPLSGPRRRRRIPGGGLGVTQPHSLCCPAQWQELEGRMMGRRVSVRVSPVARASEKLTTLSLEPTRATDDAAVSEVAFTEDWPQEDVINATSYLALDSGRRSSTRLLDPGGLCPSRAARRQGRLWPGPSGGDSCERQGQAERHPHPRHRTGGVLLGEVAITTGAGGHRREHDPERLVQRPRDRAGQHTRRRRRPRGDRVQ